MQSRSHPNVASKQNRLVRRSPRPLALEQRFMFDGAAVADAVDTTHQATETPADNGGHLLSVAATDSHSVSATLVAAQAAAEQLVGNVLASPDAQAQLFSLFHGDQGSTPSAAWLAAFDQLMNSFRNGDTPVRVELRSNTELQGAKGAFSMDGTTGQATIYLNADWLAGNGGEIAGADSASITRVLVEELGHYLDATLNAGGDTAGDEGEIFSRVVIDGADPQLLSYLTLQDDRGDLTIDGQSVQAEFASFTFSNAYEMVYDLNSNGSIDNNERWADKEQNLHYFNASNALGQVQIVDGTGNQNFSGNDVSATSIVIGGTTYYGWISRPIKANGDVKGFYFWTDVSGAYGGKAAFTSLPIAQADGNMDGDSTSVDNRGFLLVVDQAWFDSQIVATKGASTVSINSTKDGVLNNIWVANVGSSSDRVDASLNSLLAPNAAPTPVNDSRTVLEDSGANTGNVLTNDTDPNNNSLTVTGFSINGVAGTMNTDNTIAGVGTFRLNTDGSYTFTPDANYAGPVPAITYTASDGALTGTATLSIVITPVNDAPAGTDKTITARQSVPYTFTSADFGFTDPNDIPANTISSVVISTLPASGTLTLNGVAVTAGQEIALADLTKLQFTDTNGTAASFTFKVRDNGGTANGGIDLDPTPNTITINISNVNHAPVGVADTATAVEAGGVSNGTAGTNPTRNAATGVLANDTDVDSGDTMTVTTVTGVLAGTVGTATNGLYGALTLNADGSYTYVVDNTNAAVQALRLSSNTLTDTFTYTVTDAGGLTSTATLTVTIQGANDAPVANPDFNTATISTTVRNTINGSTVLANDTDVDANSESKTIIGLAAAGQYVSFAAGSTSTSLSFAAGNSSFYNGVAVGDYVYTANLGSNTYYHLKTAAGAYITVTSKAANADGTYSIGLSGTVDHYNVNSVYPATNGTEYDFATVNATDGSKPTGTIKSATITTSTTVTLSTVTLNGVSGNIVVGMDASGANIPAGAKVTAVSISGGNTVVTLDKDITTAPAGTITFSATAGSTVNGTYGSLLLNADGTYTYTTFIDANASGLSGVDVFTYTMQDAATNSPRLTSSSTLTINVQGPSPVVTAVADAKTISEDGSIIDNVLTNDTASSGTKSVTGFTWNGQTGTLGTPLTVTGIGTLTLSSTGAYTFTPVANYSGSVPVVNYTMTNGTYSAAATLTITITPANDAPVANADTASATEAGGYGNGSPGTNPSGNVLSNDTDVDTGDTKTVSAISGGTVGVAKAGSYGSLTLNANGTYTYTVDNNNATVQALAVGGTLTDTFTYTMRDTAGLTSSATLSVTINGANDAPVNTLPGSTTTAAFETSTSISGISIGDVDNTTGMTTQLTVSSGTLNVTLSGSATISAGSNGSSTLTLSGSKADINATLASLSYTGGANFSGIDALTIQTTDPGGLVDSDVLAITVSADNRPVTVAGSTVNEASPYVMFQVGGAAGQQVSLSLSSGSATKGLDFAANLEYFNGTTWVAYTGAPVSMPGATMLVRVAVYQDTLNEGSETLTLTATNKAGTASAPGISTIRDDAQGAIYTSGNNSFTANNSGDPGYPTYLDDDRPVTVNNISVNEGSPHAVFTVTGATGQVIRLELADGSANVAGGAPPLDGTQDYGPGLEINDGSGWAAYTPGNDITLTGSTLFVRTLVVNDTPFEGQEAFFLKVTKQSSGAITSGIGNIYDDGTGSYWIGNATTAATNTDLTNNSITLNDDRTLSIDSPNVNEGSDYVVFTLTGNSGQTVSLQLVDESSNGTVSGKANIDETQVLKIWDGLAWVDYNVSNLPTFNANGKIFVRVDIQAEHDTPYEGPESFKLNATLSGTSSPVSGTATIYDDGTQVKYPGTFSGGNPDTDNTSLDNDQTGGVAITAYGPVNEGSTYAMFTVNATPTWTLDLGLGNTASVADRDATISGFTTIQFSDDGSNWTTYVAGSAQPTVSGSGKVYVRVNVTSENEAVKTYEGPETFTLTATRNGDPSKSDTATTTIIDDGTGTIYGPNMPSGTPQTSTSGLDDDRPNFSVNDVTVNEAAGTLTFTVTKTGDTVLDASVAYATANNTATSGAGNDYTAASGTLTFLAGDTSKTVTISINDDNVFELSEAFNLNLSAATNATIGDNQGVGTIKDDGTGDAAHGGSGSGTDDDRPSFSVNDVTVNEAAGTLSFTVTKTGSTTQTATVDYATANGTATSGAGNDYTAASGTLTFLAGDTTKMVTISINNDNVFELSEAFNLNLSNATNATISDNQGVGTINDDGTGSGGTNDDRPTISVTGRTVNEAAGTLTFTVNLSNPSTEALTFTPTLSSGTATVGSDTGSSAALEYWNGANWVSAAGGITMAAGVTSVQVRTQIVNDSTDEGSESFSLNTGPVTIGATANAAHLQNQAGASGTGTINDDGTGGDDDGDSTDDATDSAKDDDRSAPVSPVSPVPPPAPTAPPPEPLPPAAPGVVVPPVDPAPQLPPSSPGFESTLPQASVQGVPSPVPDNLVAPVANDLSALRATGQPGLIGDIYTSPTGFRVVVIEAPYAALSLFRGVADQYAETGSKSSFAVPYDAFAHSDPNERISLSATQSDGSKLPGWVQFDASSGKFEFAAPTDYQGELKIKVTARDSKGNEVNTLFRFNIGEKRSGRAGLSEQLRQTGRELAWGRSSAPLSSNLRPASRAA